MTTTLESEKQLHNVSGRLVLDNVEVHGYEIHAGISTGSALESPAVLLNNKQDGAISEDNQVMGTYLHGLFESAAASQAILDWAGLKNAQVLDYHALREAGIDRMADAVEEHLDLDFIFEMLELDAPVNTVNNHV